MKTKTEKLMALGLGVCLVTQLTWAQGSLTPLGAPAPTMKTLEQIEPRRVIAGTGYVITQPGSYYLATNLITTAGAAGIQIVTNDVTVDLNGFSILGESGDGYGITINDGCRNILVRNGTIRNCYHRGLYAENASQCAFEDLRILNNGHYFMFVNGLRAGKSAKVVNCRLEGNGGNGLVVRDACEVRGCAIVSNTCGLTVDNACRIEGNTIVNNATYGLRITGSGSYVAENIVKGNADNYDLASDNQLNLLICEIPESLDWSCSARLVGTLTCAQTASNGIGIIVNADHVTIDLGGHALIGPGASSGNGIYQAATFRNLTVCNGKVVNWRGTYSSGVYADGNGNRVHGIQAATNYNGISTGSGCVLSDCTACNNKGFGIQVWSGSALSGCVAYNNGDLGILAGPGSALSGCAAYTNRSYGIYAGDNSTLSGCAANNNSNGIHAGSGSRLSDCTACTNRNFGVYAGSDSTLSGCTASDNNSYGIFAGSGSTLSDCAASHNSGGGIDAGSKSTLSGCAASFNQFNGITVSPGSTLNGCATSDNKGRGIFADSDCTLSGCSACFNSSDGILIGWNNCIERCVCIQNGVFAAGAGIHVLFQSNRIEGNHVALNDRGIDVDSVGNFIARNTARGNNTLNWDIVAGNVCLVVQATAAGAISGDSGGAAPGSTDPNANFTF